MMAHASGQLSHLAFAERVAIALLFGTIIRPFEGSEVVTSYEVRAVCGREIEERVRATMIAAIRNAGMTLIAVYSDDEEGADRVEVIADVTVIGQSDAHMERIVTAVGLESRVSSVSWKIVPTSEEERVLVPDA